MGRVRNRHWRQILPCIAALMCLFENACVRLEYGGRDHLRIAPLKQKVMLPAEWSHQPIPVDAGTDTLRDDELAPLANHLRDRVQVEASTLRNSNLRFAQGLGRGVVRGCQLRAGAGRRNTIYKAHCRAVWLIKDVEVAHAVGEATLLAPAKAVTRKQAEEIARKVRNPLLSADDARRVLEEASVHSMHQLIGWKAPKCGHALPTSTKRSAPFAETKDAVELLGKQARRNLSAAGTQEKLAAISDLMRYGVAEDARDLHGILDEPNPTLRRAAALALSELVWSQSLSTLLAHQNDPDAETRHFVRLGISRIRAFYGLSEDRDLSAPPATRALGLEPGSKESSKSSTPGGRDMGEIPASAR